MYVFQKYRTVKSVFAVFLAVVFAFLSLTPFVYADETTEDPGDNGNPYVYAVEIEFGSFGFYYDYGTWNEDSFSYEETEKKKRRSMKEIKELIIEALREENALSSTELSEKMGYSGRSSSLSKAIGELLSENEIEYSADISRHSRNQKLSLKK